MMGNLWADDFRMIIMSTIMNINGWSNVSHHKEQKIFLSIGNFGT